MDILFIDKSDKPPGVNPEQDNISETIDLVVSTISVIASLCALATFLVRRLNTIYMKLAISLILTDLVFAITNLIDLPPKFTQNEVICGYNGFFKFLSTLMGTAFILQISRACYNQCTERNYSQENRYIVLLAQNLIFSSLWALPGLFGNINKSFPFTYGYYKRSGDCQLRPQFDPDSDPKTVQYLYFIAFIPMLLIFFLTVYYTFGIIKQIRLQEMTVSSTYIVKAVGAYPIIMFISWFPALISSSFTAIFHKMNFYLHVFHILVTHLQGFFDAIYFIWIGTKKKSSYRKYQTVMHDDDDADSIDGYSRSFAQYYRQDSLDSDKSFVSTDRL